MNFKKNAISVILIFVVAMIWNGVFHMVVIAEQNNMISDLRRSDISDMMFLSIAITIMMAILFAVSYSKWLKAGSLKESLVHGLFFALLAGVLVNANQYLVYPIPGMLAGLWFFGGLIEFSLYSVIVWLVYRYGRHA